MNNLQNSTNRWPDKSGGASLGCARLWSKTRLFPQAAVAVAVTIPVTVTSHVTVTITVTVAIPVSVTIPVSLAVTVAVTIPVIVATSSPSPLPATTQPSPSPSSPAGFIWPFVSPLERLAGVSTFNRPTEARTWAFLRLFFSCF